MKNKLFFLMVFLISTYVYIYFLLISNLESWIVDIKSCFKVMEKADFFIEHTNVFFYLILFGFMSFSVLKVFIKAFLELKKAFLLKNSINLLKIKSYKNIIIINFPKPVAFNFLDKIVLSSTILKGLSKKEKKAVFYHEVGHLKNLDSFKLFVINIALSLFPKLVNKKLFSGVLLEAEHNADTFASLKVGKESLANALINVKSLISSYPLMNNFTQKRIEMLLEKKDFKLPKTIWFISLFFFTTLFLLLCYKTCFCGTM
ncbi:MAG: M48 family metalloprotease [Aquificae bacterium]|nr:M48 family metalloprotease [Aquificota bacterium]